MYEQKVLIRHDKGLHTRVAAMIVQKSSELQSRYQVSLFLRCRDRERIPATNLMQIVTATVKKGEIVSVSAQGDQIRPAVWELVQLLESDFPMSNGRMLNQVDRLLQDNALTAEHVFSSVANGLIVTDENDIITIFNPAAERIMDLSAAEVIGRKADQVIPGSRMHVVTETQEAELGCRQVLGASIIITNRSPIIVDGKVKGAVAIFEDISVLDKVTGELQEVKELKERLQLLLESVQDGISVVNREGYVTYVNPAYERMLNKGKDLIIGQNVRETSPDGARSRALSTGKPVSGEIRRKSAVTVIADAYPIIVDGEVTGVVSIVKDISEVQILMEKLTRLAARAEYLEQELQRTKKPGKAFEHYIGKSGKVLDALAIAAKAAEGPSTVIIRGESGTGKELVAEGIHAAGPRARGPFIRVNCAAIPENLLESELFGHEKGAFTGAIKRKLGKFELARNGVIFLDEIGEMDKNMQVKLLRALQQKEITPVGGEETRRIDVKIIAATNQDLEQMVAEGRFREDLYYRLNVIPIHLPPLRERQEDIPLLVEHFIGKIARNLDKKIEGISREALAMLMEYPWPGNVRELENIIERVVTLTDHGQIGLSDLPVYLREAGKSSMPSLLGEPSVVSKRESEPIKNVVDDSLPALLTWEEYEKEIIALALKKHGSFNAAGKALGLTHKTIAAKARKYGIEKTIAWENG
ncbi:PAS domain S-box protein [Heliobacillus mobilis]|uniref:HTH-type transcriptional regulatory protein TyrR n=1 Tax=Heliobacterium mobile TaxID=28064 RepID=A0A6I3SM66_HELMO|nr:sigma 54-interacting transcriptional regulator [Heliobacterium mobile]MTV49979.1 PAS domain S-box protein [Heliobacterium mobile]